MSNKRGAHLQIGERFSRLTVVDDRGCKEVHCLCDCGVSKALPRQADLIKTEVLSKCEDGKLYKAVVRKCQRNIDQQISWDVFRRDDYSCRYCCRNDVPLTVDHLVLWENGGPTTENNLVAACNRCNKKRGNMEYADWIVHSYYLRVALNLSIEQRKANTDLVSTLPGIKLVINVRSKR